MRYANTTADKLFISASLTWSPSSPSRSPSARPLVRGALRIAAKSGDAGFTVGAAAVLILLAAAGGCGWTFTALIRPEALLAGLAVLALASAGRFIGYLDIMLCVLAQALTAALRFDPGSGEAWAARRSQ